jgi:hypothetical protein
MIRKFKERLTNESGLATVEIVIILVALVGVAILFGDKIMVFVTRILDDILSQV